VIVRVLRRASAGLAVVALVTACDNNPLADNRDRGEWFDLNPSNVAVNAGGTVLVTAIVRNQFGAATNAPVTATPCDAKVSAVRDTTRSAFEFPERFVVTGASSLGTSCLVVSGGGLTDTIRVRVVPASIRASGADTLTQLVGSGETVQAQVEFRNTAGAPATGFTLSDVTFTSLTPAQAVVDASGQISGQAPGIGRVVVRLHSQYGVTRVDTLVFRVQAGAFGGTVALSTLGPATGSVQVATFTQGSISFQDNTAVQLEVDGAVVQTFNLITSGTTRQVVLPFGLPPGPVRYNVVNLPNNVAQTGTINHAMPEADTQEPDETIAVSPKVMSPGQTFFGSVSGGDGIDFIRVNITEAGNYTFTLGWNDASDHDFQVRAANGTTVLLRRETLANPEVGTLNDLQPGTYWVRVEVYDFAPNGGRASTYRLTVEKL
jgi:hypothetical protein